MDKSYRDLFFAESTEYLKDVNKHLVSLEKNPHDDEAINNIFRLMHTLKGMAATMRFVDIAEVAHKLEDAFDSFRTKKIELTPAVMDIVFSVIDIFTVLVEDAKEERESKVDVDACIKSIESILPGSGIVIQGKSAQSVTTKVDQLSAASITQYKTEGKSVLHIEVSFVKTCAMRSVRAFLVLNRVRDLAILLKVSPSEANLKNEDLEGNLELIVATVNDKQKIKSEIEKIYEVEKANITDFEAPTAEKIIRKDVGMSTMKKIQSMRIPVERLDKIMNLMGELSIAKSRLLQISQAKEYGQLDTISSFMGRLVSSLQDEALKLRLLPISFVLDNFPRMVRDLSRQMGKDIEMEIAGSDIELDRAILDEIGDPMMHLIRNSIDHGIESPAERLAAKKPREGKIAIKVFREKGHIIIEISDDGKGVDANKVLEKARKNGIITAEEGKDFDKAKVLDILTMPGFSTKEEVTDISGRGVGLDVVRTKLDMLGGRLEMDTQQGKGTTFVLTLPLTLAIIKAMLVGLGKELYAIPLMNIRETVKLSVSDIKMVKDMEVIRLRDEIIPVVRLAKELGTVESYADDDQLSVVIVEGRAKSMGFIVDKVISEQDVVVKPLGAFLKRVKGITGATILGDGRVVLILDVVNVK